jgi:ribosomal protein L37AE/L43A
VCNLVAEVETCIRMDPQSENNDAEEGDSRRRAPDAQSDPEYETEDHDDDDSSGEEDEDDSQDPDFTLQPVRSKRKFGRHASKMYGKSPALKPKRSTTNPQKKSRPHVDDKEASSARPVSCPICHKQFKGGSAKGNLKTHLDSHAPEPKYPCPHCNARFTQGHNRHRHIKIIHHKVKRVIVKKFECQFCGKKFAIPSHKKEHEMVSNIATTDFVFLSYYDVYNSG